MVAEASALFQADHEPEAEAAPVPVATAGVLEVERLETPVFHALQSEDEDLSSTGVELLAQEVEVLVQTGTEMVHGQSVTVRVVEAETV